ncbi:MAG: DUF6508 domain-containing protein [Candidatus Cloacimonetes bacterium]|jgi:hypothetical protein|nr:DUF6508 domain-containing protein [Candidatus Cloacimonadota bacterium]MDD2230843.1 DUF6508 domain-containing protein [Candidatus Cloacimonadota bacterium]
MGHYDQILEYISYFETESNEYGKEVFTSNTMAYWVYENKLESFMRCISESDLMRVDYLSYIDGHNIVHITERIENADIELLKAMFTYFNRQERFQEGLWAMAAERGIFLRLLKRLKEIVNQRSNEEIECQV